MATCPPPAPTSSPVSAAPTRPARRTPRRSPWRTKRWSATSSQAGCGIWNERRPPAVIAFMRIDVWSDVVCPFCYLGKSRLEHALEQFPHRDEVEVVWRSFELDPTATTSAEPLVDLLSRKYGMSREDAQANQDRLTA